SGAMVGVNTAIATVPTASGPGGGSVGLGFAIPSEFAVQVADQLIADGRVSRPTLGLQVQTLPLPAGSSAGGLYVVSVQSSGPAENAGLQAGDVITSVDGQPATSADQLVLVTVTGQPGDKVPLEYERDGTSHSTELTLGPAG
ncbi:MAG: PDZ domain-containing protein, partial [Actinomycetes bacterium]